MKNFMLTKKLVISRHVLPISLFRLAINIIVIALVIDRLWPANKIVWSIFSVCCGVVITLISLLKLLEKSVNLFDFSNVKEPTEDKKERTKVFDLLKSIIE